MAQQRNPLASQNVIQRYRILFLCMICVVLFTYYIRAYLYSSEFSASSFTRAIQTVFADGSSKSDNNKTYYILLWTTMRRSPFYHMSEGRSKFIKLSCPYQNCYVTDNKTYMSVEDFDAIVFNGNDVIRMEQEQLPQQRSLTQKFVFGGTESAHNKLACRPVLDNFFNWTWTYRLDSDVRWSYVLIYDLDGVEVGPRIDMKWPEEMKPIEDEETLAVLDGKTKAAAWFVTHCSTLGRREDFVNKVKPELAKWNLSLDIYGKCGQFECPRNIEDECYEKLKKEYYFYFSFENSFAVDYVTEKLLNALKNYVVPVVYGSADYSRFLPPGSYLNARELGPEKLASTMKEIIDSRTRYHDFFRWRNHFRYKRGENGTEICNLCTALNDEDKVSKVDILSNFREWWNQEYNSKICKNYVSLIILAILLMQLNFNIGRPSCTKVVCMSTFLSPVNSAAKQQCLHCYVPV